jgi:rhodanese-related sulfurtransferase
MIVRELKNVGPATVAKLAEQGAKVVDVREVYEYVGGRIPGSENLPLSTLARAELALAPGQAVVFLCASGGRTSTYGPQLAAKANGANGYVLAGGIAAWAAAGFPIDRAPSAGQAAKASLFGRLFSR